MDVLCTYERNGVVLTVTGYTDAPAASRGARSRAPGAGRFDIGEITLEFEDAQAIVTARVRGGGIAFVYGDVALKDPRTDRFYGPVARGHARAETDRLSSGGLRPEWGTDFTARVALGLDMTVLSDGAGAAFCFASPEGYGSLSRRVDGVFQPSGSAQSFRARLLLDQDGGVKRLIGYKAFGRRTLPRPLLPRPGDTFTPLVEVLSPNDGEGWSVSGASTTPLTFSERGPVAALQPPLPGDYLAGLLVEDLDGRISRTYAPFSIGGG